MNIPKCLVLDIETAPIEVLVWDIKGDQYINHSQIKQDWFIIAWGAKWLNTPATQMIYADQRNSKNVIDDKALLTPLRDLIDQADFVMTQNGKRFDWPKIKARFMLHRFEPPSYFQHVDIYKELKDIGFTSHSLEYLTNKFCKKYKKLKHNKFPGLSLWTSCLAGNKMAWEEMKKYNIHDVLSTEELYANTAQWLPKVQYKLASPVVVCKKCGGKQFGSNGTRPSNGALHTRKFCRSCGDWLLATEKVA